MSKLPPLPDYFAYTRDDMRDYALAAVSERDALLRQALEALQAMTASVEAVGDDLSAANGDGSLRAAHMEQQHDLSE